MCWIQFTTNKNIELELSWKRKIKIIPDRVVISFNLLTLQKTTSDITRNIIVIIKNEHVIVTSNSFPFKSSPFEIAAIALGDSHEMSSFLKCIQWVSTLKGFHSKVSSKSWFILPISTVSVGLMNDNNIKTEVILIKMSVLFRLNHIEIWRFQQNCETTSPDLVFFLEWIWIS